MHPPGGQTEDAAEVFAMRVPYLQSVASPGEEGYDGYAREQRFTLTEAAAKLSEAFPDSGVEADALPAQLELLALTDTGRVKEMRVGSVTGDGAGCASGAGAAQHDVHMGMSGKGDHFLRAGLWARRGHESGGRLRHGGGWSRL